MQGIEVTLPEMLACRERRAEVQRLFITQFRRPVLSFCMNIPGPVKTTPQIRSAFETGKLLLAECFRKRNIRVLAAKEFHEPTGDELILSADCRASVLKELTTKLEETHPFGRLFDMDVIDTDGQKLSRSTRRKCLICGCPAQECARSRRHTIREMQDKIEEILR